MHVRRCTTLAAALALAASLAAAQATDPGDRMAQGKLQADLGHMSEAAAAFDAVAQDPARQRRTEVGGARAPRCRPAGDGRRCGERHGVPEGDGRLRGRPGGRPVPGSVGGWRLAGPRPLGRDLARRANRSRGRAQRPAAGGHGLAGRRSGAPFDRRQDDGRRLRARRARRALSLFADFTGLNVVVQPGRARAGYDPRAEGAVGARAREDPGSQRPRVSPRGQRAVDRPGLGRGRMAGAGFYGRGRRRPLPERGLARRVRLVRPPGRVRALTSPEVAGHVTLRLERVPWDQALDVVLRVNGLEQRRQGSRVEIAPRRAAPRS